MSASEQRATVDRQLPGIDAGRLGGFGLTRREMAVLEIVAHGSTNAETAKRLGISPLTVKKHLERMYTATGAPNRAALIALLSDGARGSAVARPRHGLPTALTSFIGREREIEDVSAILTTARLVTLGGPGGIGKTRLAFEVARRVGSRFRDGPRAVELGDVTDPRLVLQAVSSAVGVRASGRTRIGSLLEELRSKEMLIVLDNCEQVVGACGALVEALLRGCAGVRCLATSREALGVEGEAFWQVPPLSVPELVTASGPVLRAAVERSEAARLFVERASLRRQGFALTVENARTIAHICRALDGMPLAIELAAARSSVLSVQEIAGRLDDRFRELADPDGVTPRHRTLRGVVDWSYQLLAPADARLFERLSVFAGGCTLRAAEAVCAAAEVDRGEILGLIGRLVNRSFIIADTRSGETRYRTLETLQRYAREQLERRADGDETRRRHASFFCAIAEEAEPKLKGPEQLEWYERLEVEHDNLRAALKWSLERDPETALRLAGALWRFWDVRMYKEEGRRWLEAALAHEASASVPVRIKALNGAGNMAQSTGDYPRAVELHQRSLTLARGIGDSASIGRSLSNLGDQALNVGDHERSLALHSEALALFERMGDPWGIAISCIELGQVAYDLGDVAGAERHYVRGLEMARASGDEHRTAHALLHVGKVARERGDLDGAARSITAALRTVVAFGDAWMSTIAVGQIACLTAARGNAPDAVRLFAAVDAAQRALAIDQAPHWGRDLGRWAARAREVLDPAVLSRTIEKGEAMPLDAAVAAALDLAELPAATTSN